MVFLKKRFGQNFISDKNLINKIINCLDQDKDQLIIEIGPGKGALTKEICNKYKKVIAIEIDESLKTVLQTNIISKNFELIIGDILQIDLKKLILNQSYKKVSIISNLPYYITSEILFKTLEISSLLSCAVFMMQKEVASRICAKKDEKNYNNLSVACQFYSELKYEFSVSKKMFYPVPKVDSAIVSFKFTTKNLKKINDDKKFIAFVRKIFNNKRKTILNNLFNITNDKEKAARILQKIDIDKSLRPENITIDQFILLWNEVQNEN